MCQHPCPRAVRQDIDSNQRALEMACSEKQNSPSSSLIPDLVTDTLSWPESAPVFSTEEEARLEQKRSSMRQEMEEAMQKLQEWKKQRSLKNDSPPK